LGFYNFPNQVLRLKYTTLSLGFYYNFSQLYVITIIHVPCIKVLGNHNNEVTSRVHTVHGSYRSYQRAQKEEAFSGIYVPTIRVRGPTSGGPRGSEATGKGIMRMIDRFSLFCTETAEIYVLPVPFWSFTEQVPSYFSLVISFS